MAIFCQKNVKSLGLTINTKEFPDNKKYGIKYGLHLFSNFAEYDFK